MSRKDTITIALGVIIAFILVLCFTSCGGQAHADRKPIPYTVHRGDTLWQIAESHNPDNRDVRAVVDDIEQINHLQDATILPGQKILIP